MDILTREQIDACFSNFENAIASDYFLAYNDTIKLLNGDEQFKLYSALKKLVGQIWDYELSYGALEDALFDPRCGWLNESLIRKIKGKNE